jgi:hypothetical protein
MMQLLHRWLEALLLHEIESYWQIGPMLKPLMILWPSVFRVLLLFQIWLNVCRFEGVRFNHYKIKFRFCSDCSWILGEGTEFFSKKIKSSRSLWIHMRMAWERDIPNWSKTPTVFENNTRIS